MPTVVELPSGRFRVQWRDRAGNKVGPNPARSFATRSAARTYGLDREAEVRRGEDQDPTAGRALLRVWMAEWLDGRVGEARTLSKMAGHIDKYVLRPVGTAKPLGDLPLEAVDEQALQAWVKRMQRTGLSAVSVDGIFTTVATSLRAAVRARRLPADPTQDVILPTIPPASDFFWERDELAAIRGELPDPLDLAVFELLIGTGVRWGEAAGLHLPRWMPLRRRLTVVDVLVEDHGFTLKQYPKGKKQRHVPALAPELLEAMAAHLATTRPVDCGLAHKDSRGKRMACEGIVFHVDGKSLSRHAWPRQVFAPAVKAAGARPGRVQDLRHSYASHLVMDGVPPRVVQGLLGHASSRTTERYAHLAPGSLDDPRLTASLLGRTARAREADREPTLPDQQESG